MRAVARCILRLLMWAPTRRLVRFLVWLYWLPVRVYAFLLAPPRVVMVPLPPPPNTFLTAEQLDELAVAAAGRVNHVPPDGVSHCTYCGAATQGHAYTYDGTTWPACCFKVECLDKWEPNS